MGLLDSIFGSFLGPLGSLGGSLMSNMFGDSRQEDAQAFSAQQYAHRYQTTVKDMQAAGLNPMLAYTQGPGNSPTSNPISVPDMGNSLGNAFSAASQREQNQSLIDSQVGLNNASAFQSNEIAQQARANTDKIREEIETIPYERERLRQTAIMLSDQANLLREQGKNASEQNAVIRATASNLIKDGVLKQSDIDAIQKFDNFGPESKQLAPIFSILRTILLRRQ